MSEDKDHRRYYVLQKDLQELGLSKSLVQRITKDIPFSTASRGAKVYDPERIVTALTNEAQKDGIRPATREKLLTAIASLSPKKPNVVEVDFAKNLTLDEQMERDRELLEQRKESCRKVDDKIALTMKEHDDLMVKVGKVLSQDTKTESRSPKRKAEKVELKPIDFSIDHKHPWDNFGINPFIKQAKESLFAISSILSGFMGSVDRAKSFLPQIPAREKDLLRSEMDYCNSEIAEKMKQLDKLTSEMEESISPRATKAGSLSVRTKIDEYEQKLAELNQRANAILQDELDEADEPQGKSPEELDAHVEEEVEKLNRFLDTAENRDLSGMNAYQSRAIRMSTYSSLHSKLNNCETEIADDVEKLKQIQADSLWTPSKSLALWASAKQRAERLIKEWSDDEQEAPPEIEYFKSECDRIIYALVESDGEDRCKALGVTKAHTRIEKTATEWRNNLAKVIHPDICRHPKASEAFAKLTDMYEQMTRR